MREPVKRLKLYEAMKSDIASGVYLSGAFLPDEFKLAEKYGYSRDTIRSALTMLENDKLLELIKCKGRRICPANAGKTWRIGYLIGDNVDLNTHFYNRFFIGIEKAATDAGYSIMIEHYRQEEPEFLCRHKVDGIIIEVQPWTIDVAGISSNCPSVLLNCSCREIICDMVPPDITGTISMAIKHLKDFGHEKIAFIDVALSQDEFYMKNINRVETWNSLKTECEFYFPGSSIAEKYFKMLHIATADSVPETEAAIGQAIDDFIAMPDGPTAIICADAYAIIFIKKAREKGIKIPGQLSVVGFNNRIECEHCVPALTSIDNDATEMGRMAVELLLRRIKEPDRAFVRQSCPSKLIVRKSSGPCPCNSKAKTNIN